MESLKITQEDFRNRGTSSLPDHPSEEGLRAGEIKTKMDELVTTVVRGRFNDLLDALGAASAAGLLGALDYDGQTASTVQTCLNALQSQLQALSQGAVADGSVTDRKLSGEADDLLMRFAAHAGDGARHAANLGETGGSGLAYTATGALPAHGQALFLVQAHTSCGASPTLALSDGAACALVTGSGQPLSAGRMVQFGTYALLYTAGVPGTFTVLNPEPAGHTHVHQLAQVIGLPSELAGKAQAVHGHTQQDVLGLSEALGTKAEANHLHGIYATVAHTHNTFAAVQISGDLDAGELGVGNVYITTSATAVPADAPNGTLVLRVEA